MAQRRVFGPFSAMRSWLPCLPHQPPEFVHAARLVRMPVQHGVAVRADRDEVVDEIDGAVDEPGN